MYVTSNAPDNHGKNFAELFDACLQAEPETQAVVLSLQDFKNDISPRSVVASGDLYRKEFSLQSKILLDSDVGQKQFCKKVSFMKRMGASFVACGGVALMVYTYDDVSIEVGSPERKYGSVTDTTRKGSVSAVLNFNGQRIVVASTHAEEGVRGKRKGTCPKRPTAKDLQPEEKRVQDFQEGLSAIMQLRGDGDAVLWGGDFNPRTQSPQNGCPIWPEPLPVASSTLGISKPSLADVDSVLKALMPGRDIIGASPQQRGTVTSFSAELSGTDIKELPGMKCPTYKKRAEPSPVFTGDDIGLREELPQDAVQCFDSEISDVMFYLDDKPMAWTDRIFASSTPWLECNSVQRITHSHDHDAVLTACTVTAP